MAILNNATQLYHPDQYLNKLLNDNSKFIKKVNKKVLEALKAGQTPEAVMITCSDSRIVPEYIFNKNIGSFFTIRTAGEILGNIDIGSLEYAVIHLNVRKVIILGHTDCGAIKAALEHHKTHKLSETKNIDSIINTIEPVINEEEKQHHCKNRNNFSSCIAKSNVMHIEDKILKSSKIISDLYQKNEIKFYKMIYDVKGGNVSAIK